MNDLLHMPCAWHYWRAADLCRRWHPGNTMIRSTFQLCAPLLALAMASSLQAQPQAPRSAASLADITGSVLVNRGEQFVAGVDGDVLASGDRVMALAESGALLRYDDGCDVRVEPETVVTLSEGSPCAGWLLAVESVAPSGLAVGAGAAAATGVSPWVYVPAIAVAGFLVYEEFFDSPSSP